MQEVPDGSVPLSVSRFRRGWIRFDGDDLTIDVSRRLRPWVIYRASIAQVDWYSVTGAVFRGGPHPTERIDVRDTVWLQPRFGSGCNLTLWSDDGLVIPDQWSRWTGLRGATLRFFGTSRGGWTSRAGIVVAGLRLTYRGDPVAAKRAFEAWGIEFPEFGSPS